MQSSKKQPAKTKGALNKFVECIWGTTVTSEDKETNQEKYVKETFKQMTIYIVFLVVVCLFVYLKISRSLYTYTRVMKTLFLEKGTDSGLTFKTIFTVDQFWDFAQGPLLDGLYWDKWYNGEDLANDTTSHIYYENKLLGVPRFRQLRVHSNSCEVNEEFETFISECYSAYAEEYEDTQPFGKKKDTNNTAWIYQSEDDLGGDSIRANLHTYSGAGYVKDLALTRVESEEIIKELSTNLWIQRGARAVFVAFTVYNANINLFCVVSLVVEFPATGGALPFWSLQTVDLIKPLSITGIIGYVLQGLFFLFIVYYIIEEVLQYRADSEWYRSNPWNLLDLTMIIMGIFVLMYSLVKDLVIQPKINEVIENPDKYVNFQHLADVQSTFNILEAIMTYLAWFKVFSFISFNKTMTQLTTTLSRCAKDLMGFFLMFFIVFLAFTQLGYLLFGTQVRVFSTFKDSFFTLFRIILGDFDFHQLEQANRFLGPLFFMLFVFFVFFVLINMFLAIINDAYSEVKSDMARAHSDFIMSDYVKQSLNKMLAKIKPTKDGLLILDLKTPTKDDEFEDYETWKDVKLIGRFGFKEEDIDNIYYEYGVDEGRIVEKNEQKKIIQALQKKRLSSSEDPKKKEPEKEVGLESEEIPRYRFMELTRRIDRLEGAIGLILRNIDSVLERVIRKKK